VTPEKMVTCDSICLNRLRRSIAIVKPRYRPRQVQCNTDHVFFHLQLQQTSDNVQMVVYKNAISTELKIPMSAVHSPAQTYDYRKQKFQFSRLQLEFQNNLSVVGSPAGSIVSGVVGDVCVGVCCQTLSSGSHR